MQKDKMNFLESRIEKDYTDEELGVIAENAMKEIISKCWSTLLSESLKKWNSKILVNTNFSPAWTGFILCDTSFRHKIEKIIDKQNLTFEDFSDNTKIFLREINVEESCNLNAVIQKSKLIGLFKKGKSGERLLFF